MTRRRLHDLMHTLDRRERLAKRALLAIGALAIGALGFLLLLAT